MRSSPRHSRPQRFRLHPPRLRRGRGAADIIITVAAAGAAAVGAAAGAGRPWSAVWRSALGVDAQGNLIYAAAPLQTGQSMAVIMSRLHCVRAMELDINPEWPIMVTYGQRGAGSPQLFVPNPNQIPGRFLYTSTKDFFAVFTSTHPGEPQPW